jgi:hypothetical protein
MVKVFQEHLEGTAQKSVLPDTTLSLKMIAWTWTQGRGRKGRLISGSLSVQGGQALCRACIASTRGTFMEYVVCVELDFLSHFLCLDMVS